mmetsp:Transcript_12704/g.26895  ORF Transcript_12704/g.26895 Transcript_12704/m.26895 type:complete len:270 (+) Transcript_12704:105-914(+)|eukprot:CAMPEP_0171340936 /NCGR_PEP_ID=MMETSP0878-20121228/8871_1 /TAXON_ID=67004 /ORGANISM="Thalassiosira weissflogii, Strain CCMP1336" /LENGTH=269 /DNA_ID=CAMNT_0011843063 /DNA_START=135 /DNA_END=944 /DNA_ORIENTATION=+
MIRNLTQKIATTANARTATATAARAAPTRLLSSPSTASSPELPESVTRVGEAFSFPNEYPGQNYFFNWCLNADGVTPLKKCAFRITKPFDLKVASLPLPKISPLKVNAQGDYSKVPEAGSDALTFETFDEVTQQTKDLLSLADKLVCPEGHAPGTRTGVRVITNDAALAPDLVAYLDRAPKQDPPRSQPVTCYVLGGEAAEGDFSGYAIEEVEEKAEDGSLVAVSVATVVVVGKKVDLKRVVAGIELSLQGLEADAKERAEKKEEEESG